MVLISEEAAKPVSVTEKIVVPATEIKPIPTLESIGDPIPFPFVNIPKHLQKYCSTYKQLFSTVDTEKCSADIYAEALALHTNSLFYGLHSYRPPSQQSRQKLGNGSSKVKWRTKDRFVSDVEAQFAIRISDELQLDEIQSYDLLISYAHDASLDASAAFMFDDESLQAVKNYYYSERSYLLQSIISVLRNTLSEEHIFHKESSEVMDTLIAQGIDDELMNQFVILAENTPLHMMNSEGALQMVDEMTTILCGLFLLYYHEAPQSLEKLLYVLGVFKATGFCENIYAAEYINFNEQIKNSIVYLKHMCVLVSLVLLQLEDLLYDDKQQFMDKIEALNLEFNNLPQPTDPNTSTTSNSSNTSTIIGNTSTRIGNASTILENSENNPDMEWGKVDAHAPVMLAWYLWKVSGATNNNLPEEDYRMMTKIIVDGGAISYLINMLKNGLDKDDIAINGYKGVVKGLVSAILSIFSENAPLWKTIPIFELYCLTNENSPPLASLFWEAELKHPVLGGWVRDASEKFPLQPAPLLQVMHALSSDADSAKNAYDYIEALTTYTVSLSDGEDLQRRLTCSQIDERLNVVVANSPVRFNSIIIPQNTRGVQTPDGIISWDLTYDGWRGIISDIYDLSKDLRIKLNEKDARCETVLASLKLISNLMSFNDEIVHRFYSAYEGMLPKILPTFLLECLHYGQPLPLSAAALNCIYYFAKTCSASQMWRKLNPTLFHSLRNAVDFQEPASRTYSVTLGILDLTDCVLHSNAQTARSELYNETVVPLQLFELEEAMRFCNAVFSNFSSWVYNMVREKWIIGSRAMDIFHKVLTDYAPIPNSGENENNSRVHKSVLLNVLVNKEVQRNLFSIISLGVGTIEESQKHKDLLETFVLLALALVDVALTMLPSEQITTLQSALFEGNTLDSIAGFSRYKINPDISVRALRILTHASETGVSLSSHVLHDHLRLRNSWLSSLSLSLSPPSSSSSSSSSMCFHILAFFCSILKYQPTLIINICGKEVPGYVEKSKKNIEGEQASLVKVVLLLFENKIMEKNPQVCSELCHLIFLLCTKAPNLDTVVELRSNKIFWEYLVTIVTSKQTETGFHISARAWALLTISLELDQPKHLAQGSFSSTANDITQLQWVVNYIPTFLKEHLNKCVPNKGFASIPIISSNFNLDTVYGDRFFFNVTRMERNYAPEGLLEKVKSANLCLSLAHSHSLFLKAWSTFLYAAHNCYSVWFVEVPKMVCEISAKLNDVLENEIEQSSIFDGVAPLFLAVCKLLPHPSKLDAPHLSIIFTQIANVFAQHTRAKPEALSHICTAAVHLVRQAGMGPTFWRHPDLLRACENLVDACWSLVDVSPSAALHDSIFSLLGSILKVTESAKLILNSKKQPSLMTLMSVLSRTLQKHENSRHAENLMSLIHQLASSPLGASSLLLDGLPNVLCNLSSPFFLSFSLPCYSVSPPSSSGHRNAWHRVWCACVRVVTQLLRSLKFTDDVARRAVEFVNTHAKRLYESINLQNKELTVGALEELEATVQLIKELAIYTNKWKYAPPEFANAWGNSIVRLSQYLVLIFSAENGLKQHIVRSRDPAESSIPENYHEELILRNLVSSFYILQLSGPQLTKLLAAQDSAALTSEVASVTYIFAPTFDFGPTSIPNVYIPIYAIHHSFAALRAMMTSATQSTNTSYPNNFHPRLSSLLISLIELSLSLFLSHLIYFLHKLDLHIYPDSVQKLHGLGAELVYQITNYLADLATYEKDLIAIRHLNSYLASILRVPQ